MMMKIFLAFILLSAPVLVFGQGGLGEACVTGPPDTCTCTDCECTSATECKISSGKGGCTAATDCAAATGVECNDVSGTKTCQLLDGEACTLATDCKSGKCESSKCAAGGAVTMTLSSVLMVVVALVTSQFL